MESSGMDGPTDSRSYMQSASLRRASNLTSNAYLVFTYLKRSFNLVSNAYLVLLLSIYMFAFKAEAFR